jgi:hypothetical protein
MGLPGPAGVPGNPGSVPNFTPIAHNFLTGYVGGAYQYAQPSFLDISGAMQPSQMPAPIYIVAGNIGFGQETNPQAPFVFSENATTGIAAVAAAHAISRGVIFVPPDGGAGGWHSLAFGNTAQAFLFHAAGTAAAPLPAQGALEVLGALVMEGYTGSSFNPAGAVRVRATSPHSPTNSGGFLEVRTTPDGTVTLQTAAWLGKGLVIGNSNPAIGSDPGVGAINLIPQHRAALPAPSAALVGSLAVVNDSTTAVIGATILGGGSNVVLAACGATQWTVAAVLT